MTTSDKINLFIEKIDFSYPPDVVYLFIKIRSLLEEKNSKGELPTLNLYCNWLVHRELDRSSRHLIDRLNNKIIEHMDTERNFNSMVSEVLGVDRLREEVEKILPFLQDLSKSKPIDWIKLFSTLFVELIDKPIKLKEYNSVKQLNYPNDIYGIKLVEHDGCICWELLSPSLENKNSRIIGPLISTSTLHI
ncbi:hypothetical protein F3J24_01885 [Comamonas sp. Tr-654]|uniref:hypothetical protein n=1 Tax=Comamonas sp. Tr-654 TaxID=2608341 RepID=UPI00141F14A4|nr:hypothetical protein [Comamonas sp. Tr-654]NIF82262.1 hypothetical protein [Comamonas sp. Tr-654]